MPNGPRKSKKAVCLVKTRGLRSVDIGRSDMVMMGRRRTASLALGDGLWLRIDGKTCPKGNGTASVNGPYPGQGTNGQRDIATA